MGLKGMKVQNLFLITMLNNRNCAEQIWTPKTRSTSEIHTTGVRLDKHRIEVTQPNGNTTGFRLRSDELLNTKLITQPKKRSILQVSFWWSGGETSQISETVILRNNMQVRN